MGRRPTPLSWTTQYALRAMVHLAWVESRGNLRGRDVAAAVGVPAPYMSKILRKLTAAGLLTSLKGHGGGFKLARSPDSIRFLDVMRAVGFDSASEDCAFGWQSCDEEHPCPLHPAWSRFKELMEEWARDYTLADVVETAELPPWPVLRDGPPARSGA